MLNTKAARLRAGLTQEEFAEKIGKQQVTVSAWENGKAAPVANFLPKICEVLGCTLDDLFAEEEEDEDKPSENAPRAET